MKKSIAIICMVMSMGVQAKSSLSLASQEKVRLAIKENNWKPGVATYIKSKNINMPITPKGTEWTAFIYAASEGRTKIMTNLYNLNVNCVNGTTAGGGTALMEAARSGKIQAMEWFKTNNLLSKFINKTDSFTNTALVEAVADSQLQAVRWLLNNGAKVRPDHKNKSNRTIFDYAKNNKEMMALLMPYLEKNSGKKPLVLERNVQKKPVKDNTYSNWWWW